MDRLPALIVALACVAGCDDRKQDAGDPPSRVNGAKTTARKEATTEAFCDVHAAPGKAAAFEWPALTAAAPPAVTSWRWVNVWATWCKPCIEEMPRLARWRDKLKLDLAFISVDESEADVTSYRKLHPETPSSHRLADNKTQETWFAQLGLTGSPPIPIHVFIDPSNRVRCVRAGGVREQDYAVIERLLAE
jgi:thiol-disulfide isomerase/thioredoxin